MVQKIPDLRDAIELWNTGQHEEARLLLEKLVRVTPESEKTWLWLARATEDRDRQHQALQKVLELDPENAVAQRIIKERFSGRSTAQLSLVNDLLGEAAFADDWQHSEATYLKILEIDPVQIDALEALTDHYAHVKQWNKGFRVLAAARNRMPDNDAEVVKLTVKFGIRSGNMDYLRSLDSLLLTHPAMTVHLLLKVSEVFARVKEYGVVVLLLQRAAELEPDNQTVLYGLANAYHVVDREADAKLIRQRIADIDRHTTLGRDIMKMLLEEDPYVPLSVRENTVVAVREAIGLALPFLLLLFLDNGLHVLSVKWVPGIVLALLGSYLVVTATSSHEQAVWKRLMPEGLDDFMRGAIGVTGGIVLVIALYFVLHTSAGNLSERTTYENGACVELIDLVEASIDLPQGDEALRQNDPCTWLRIRLTVTQER